MYLENINGPEDIKKLKIEELPVLAEETRKAWHAGGPFNVEDGSPKYVSNGEMDTTVFDSLKELLDTNEKAIVLNAGTPMGLGFVQGVRDEYVKSTILPKNI